MDINVQKFTKMFARQSQKRNKEAPGSLDQRLNLLWASCRLCVEVCNGYSDCTGHAAGK